MGPSSRPRALTAIRVTASTSSTISGWSREGVTNMVSSKYGPTRGSGLSNTASDSNSPRRSKPLDRHLVAGDVLLDQDGLLGVPTCHGHYPAYPLGGRHHGRRLVDPDNTSAGVERERLDDHGESDLTGQSGRVVTAFHHPEVGLWHTFGASWRVASPPCCVSAPPHGEDCAPARAVWRPAPPPGHPGRPPGRWRRSPGCVSARRFGRRTTPGGGGRCGGSARPSGRRAPGPPRRRPPLPPRGAAAASR